MLHIAIDETSTVKVVRVRGEVDITTAPQLNRELSNAVTHRHHVVADLRGVQYMDLSGIRALEATQQVARKQQRLLVVIAPPAPVGNIFDVVQLQQEIPIVTSQEDAFDRIHGDGQPRP
jgi:anti-sigma B factor antagonist